MATLSVLRENLRGDVFDLSKMTSQQRFENEYLERALFDGLQQHNRTFKWSTLPPAEEQLVLLLAKIKIATDLSLAFAADPKVSLGQGTRDKTGNAALLMSLIRALREEYQAVLALLSSDPDEGEITMGTLVRTDYGSRARVPSQGAVRPGTPVITSAVYEYDQVTGGRIYWTWDRLGDFDLAFIQVLIGRSAPVTFQNGTVIRTLYDVFIDPMAVPPVPPMAQQEGRISYTLMPTGRWYMAMASMNWNRLYAVSQSVPIDAENYIILTADTFAL